MATALELAGVEKPQYVEFNSLMDLVGGKETDSHYDAIYGTYEKASQRMIGKEGYKLILYPKSKQVLLYNIVNDPKELKYSPES